MKLGVLWVHILFKQDLKYHFNCDCFTANSVKNIWCCGKVTFIWNLYHKYSIAVKIISVNHLVLNCLFAPHCCSFTTTTVYRLFQKKNCTDSGVDFLKCKRLGGIFGGVNRTGKVRKICHVRVPSFPCSTVCLVSKSVEALILVRALKKRSFFS